VTAATQLAVFYATDSKILRRKVIPDDDAQLANLCPEPGESMMLLALAEPYDDTSCWAAIAGTTGTTAPLGRCCVIDDGGYVIGVCNADPALDTHPRGQLVANDYADPGDRYVDRMFLRRYVVVNGATNIVASTAWLPIPGAPPGFCPEKIRNPEAAAYPTFSIGDYLFCSLTLRIGDPVSAYSAAVLVS
jgi:hypothetical protein